MPHRTRTLSRTLIPLVAVGLLAATPTAQAAPPKSTASYSYSTPSYNPKARQCGKSDPGACPLGNELIYKLRTLQRGDRLDVIVYSISRPAFTDEVLAAADRGVKVRLLTSHAKPDGEEDGLPLWGEMQRLVDGLKKRHQTVVVGWGALSRSGHAGLDHHKIVAMKHGSDEEVWSDSGNWTYSLDTAFNDRMKVRDHQFYAGTIAHMDLLAKDRDIKTTKGAVVSTADGVRRLYFLPEAKVDPVLEWAKKAKCGKGDRVVFANFYLTAGKKSTSRGGGSNLVDQLIRFRKAGATVEVAANDAKWSTGLRARLVKAGVTVWDVNGVDVYNHRKMLAASGCGAAFGAQGSTTYNATAYDDNGNQIVTSTSAADVQGMMGGFSAMTKGAVKR